MVGLVGWMYWEGKGWLVGCVEWVRVRLVRLRLIDLVG